MSLLNNRNAKAGSLYLIGNLFNKAIAFLTIPIFTRLLTTTEYGTVSTYLSYVTICSVIVSLSLGSSLRAAYVDYKADIDSYLSSVMFLSFLNFCIISVLILIIVFFHAPKVDIILVIFCLIQAFMTTIIDTILIKYMMENAYVKRTALLAIPNIIVTILSIALILLMDNNRYHGRILAYVLVYTTLGLCYLIIIFTKRRNKIICPEYWRYAFKFSLPLVFHGLSIVLLSQSDRVMITAMRSVSETGIYSLVYSFGMIVLVITSSMESVWIPWFTEKMQVNDKKKINSSVKLYIEIVTIAVIGIMLLAPEVLTILAPEEYWDGKVLIPPIVVASFFMFLYSISVDLEYYYKSTKKIAINTIIAATTNIILNFIFIPQYGAIAAAYTTVFSYMVSFCIHYYKARKLDNELFPIKIYIKPIMIVIFFVAFTYILLDYFIIRWLIAICGFIIYVIIRRKTFSFIK